MPQVFSPKSKSKDEIYKLCAEMGHAAVLAELERRGMIFQVEVEKGYAWEWVYQQRLDNDVEQAKSLRDTARYTFWVAIATAITALLALFSMMCH